MLQIANNIWQNISFPRAAINSSNRLWYLIIARQSEHLIYGQIRRQLHKEQNRGKKKGGQPKKNAMRANFRNMSHRVATGAETRNIQTCISMIFYHILFAFYFYLAPPTPLPTFPHCPLHPHFICRVPKNIFRWQFAWLTKASFVCSTHISCRSHCARWYASCESRRSGEVGKVGNRKKDATGDEWRMNVSVNLLLHNTD